MTGLEIEEPELARKKKEMQMTLRRSSERCFDSNGVVGSLGGIPKQFNNRLKETGITAEIRQVQKTVLIRPARILTKVLEI